MSDEYHRPDLKSSEEVRDIIDRMPGRTGWLFAVLITCIAGSILLFGLKIEYPEKVSGPVTITARQAPVRLVANNPGRLNLIVSNNDSVEKNELIGYLENPAKVSDILLMEKFLNETPVDSIISSAEMPSACKFLSMGDLSTYYFNFLGNVEKASQYLKGKPFEKKEENLNTLLKSQMRLLSFNQNQLRIKRSTLNLARKSIHRDSVLFKSSAIAEQDIDRSSINYYNILQVTQEMEEENASLRIQIDDTRHKLAMLKLEKEEADQKIRMDIFSTYNELLAAIRRWKLAYAFISPIDGTLEYLNFWRDNDFISAGTEVFSILPADNPVIGQVYLPSQGAGKVTPGQDVIIKLDNYPYIEYGSITGKVKNISGLTSNIGVAGNQNISTYLIMVELPELLKTNYGVDLDFRFEIRGMADILTKRRKLIERLFDNLKYIASEK